MTFEQRPEADEDESHDAMWEEYSRWREQPVQKPWGSRGWACWKGCGGMRENWGWHSKSGPGADQVFSGRVLV